MLLLLWKRALLLAAASLLGLWSLFTATTTESLHSLPALDQLSTLGKDKPRVAILEPTPYHSEVFGALFSILRGLKIEPHMYRAAGDWTQLQQLLQETEPAPIEGVQPLLEANEFDVVIVNTCDDKFWHNHASIWATLGHSTARVLCTLHEGEYFGRDEAKAHLRPIRDRLSMLALGAHTARLLRHQLRKWAKDEWEWEGVQVHDYAPVFALPSRVRRKERPSRRVRHAGVLGRISQGNRDYIGLLSDLEQSLMASPEAWGYTLSNGKLHRQDDAFTLHLVGMKEQDFEFSASLLDSGALKLHEGVDTLEYYRLIGQMDIVLPAFRNERYVTERASASIPAATPLLATTPIVEAYTYLDPSAYVLRPVGMRPVEALRHLRLGQDPWDAAFGDVEGKSETRREEGGTRWWSTSTAKRAQKDNERLFRRLLY